MLLYGCLLILGLFLLVKGSDLFVDGASGIAQRLRIPPILIGLTVVAFGTSAPEAAISLTAALRGSSDLSIGNILGSNLLNILLILGISACLRTLPVPENTIRYEIPFVLLVSIILLVLGLLFGELGRICGLILWALFLLFLFYSFQSAKKHRAPPTQKPVPRLLLSLTVSGLGLAAILVGSDLTVDGAVYLARALGVSERIIGLTLVAFGTSLPELFTSVTAALKKQNDIAIGNIIGSNLFNILFVLGTTSLIQPIPFHQAFFWDGIFGIAATALLWLCTLRRHELRRSGGILFLGCYAAYLVFLLT